VGDKDPGKEKVIVAIYLEAEDFEAMKKVGRVVRSQYIVNAIKHFNELYHRPTFLIRCSNYVWCLQRMKPELESALVGQNQPLAKANVFFPDKGLVWKYVDDFAFVISANHSVVLKSHLAWWMAYCSPGNPVIPEQEGSILGNVRSLKLPWTALPF